MGDTRTTTGKDGQRYTLFFKANSSFSNFHPCDRLEIDGIEFTCTEQYYVFMKALFSGDQDTAEDVLATSNPAEMKRLGRSIRNFDQTQWDSVSIEVMAKAVMQKFVQNKYLRTDLMATHGSILVECNPSDPVWAIGLSSDDEDARDPATWRGRNLLGMILTKTRDFLMTSPKYRHEVEKLGLA